MAKEIERKFLLSGLPVIKPSEKWVVEQSYISVEPEVRVRSKKPAEGYFPRAYYNPYVMTIKGNGSLVRDEIETSIYQNFYNEVIEYINKKPIKKDFYIYSINNYKMEVSVVDKETSNSFIYAEVEFSNEEEAKAFIFPFPELVIEEVTNQEDWKMKNYWLNSR